MKILFMLSRFPYPLEKGDRVRAYNQIRVLSKNHEIILCALNHKALFPGAEEMVRPYCSQMHIFSFSKLTLLWNLIKGFLRGLPFQTAFFYNRKTKEKVLEIIRETKPDHIFCQLVRASEYIRDIKSIPKTLDYQDAFSEGFRRRIEKDSFWLKPFVWLEYSRLKKYESEIFNDFENKIIISNHERDLINHPGKESIHIIGNGIDTDYFAQMNKEKKYDICFVGGMDYYPNIIAADYICLQILPLLRKDNPGIKVLIAGAYPTERTLKLRSESVEISGWMDDIRDAYSSSKIFLAPMEIGVGVQNKILEAMAMKLPCIVSGLANQAINAKDNDEILICSSPQDYAEKINFLLQNPPEAERIASKGYSFVHKNFDWEATCNSLEQIFISAKKVNEPKQSSTSL